MRFYIFFILITISFLLCTKTKSNERKVVNNWKLDTIEDINFRYTGEGITTTKYSFRNLVTNSLELTTYHSGNCISSGRISGSVEIKYFNGEGSDYFIEKDFSLSGSYKIMDDEITFTNDEKSKTFLITEISNSKMVLNYFTTKISSYHVMDYNLVFVKK